jgi:low affinity Fe/Cu permease
MIALLMSVRRMSRVREENGRARRKFRPALKRNSCVLSALIHANRHLAQMKVTTMARARSKPKVISASRAAADRSNDAACSPKSKSLSDLFSRASCAIARWTGKPVAFLTAAALVIVWAATGPVFHYSDTWQLVINTSTTIVTFLMVFLIQNTQNRDTMALQLKLSELILAINEAENRFATAEELTDEELEKLHEELHRRTQTTLRHLNERRAVSRKKAG